MNIIKAYNNRDNISIEELKRLHYLLDCKVFHYKTLLEQFPSIGTAQRLFEEANKKYEVVDKCLKDRIIRS